MLRRCFALVLFATLTVPPASAAPVPDTRLGVAEGFRNPGVMTDIQAGWERLILPWDQIQPGGPDDFSRLGITISADQLQNELNRGVHVVGLLEFTPGWAAANPDAGMRSPPKNLDLPFDDPNNHWARFVSTTVKHYSGKIDDWVLWNEPEFHPSDPGAGGSFTWLGSDEQFAQLLKVGYLAVKKANPKAHVSFPGTSYWIDLLSNRPQFYERLLNILSQDPDAAANGFYHDVVSLNLYRAPDDIYRVHSLIKDIQKRYGLDKPVWLTETNAMPSDDHAVACPHADAAIKTSMDQQASYAVQAFAMAAAAGYQRFEFFQMVDQNPCAEPAVWGVTRDDGTRRPVGDALRTAVTQFAGYTNAHFVPLVREIEDWSAWPGDASSLMPNWQVYQVAFDKPGNQRVTALWNGDGSAIRIRIRKAGSSASAIDRMGQPVPLREAQGWWVLDLAPATAHFPQDPDGYHFIGGEPLLLVENGVDPSSPVVAPALGDPGSVPPLGLSMPGPVQPGQTATIHLETAGADPGIYFIDIRATGGGVIRTVQLALVVD